MRNEITEIKRAISTICAKQGRSWSIAGRNARTDLPAGRTLTSASVDAALADEAISFVSSTDKGGILREDQAQVVAGLSAQLTQLESQCSHLRRMLELASRNPH
jgi:actin-like ATPase involved in cell morphogenesis